MAQLMIMEPDARLAHRMREALTRAGHECVVFSQVKDALAAVRADCRRAALLNARLPWTDSFALLRSLEARGCPVLFITSDARNADHLRAMYQSGCDVLLSPFDSRGLVAAVDRLLAVSSRLLTMGGLRLDVQTKQATLDGEPLTLTTQEFELLKALMLSPDAALTREELLRTAWGYQGIGETRTVDVHIQRLRRKIGSANIETVYKLGYRLKMA